MTPNSTIKILKGIPLDDTYNNTWYYTNRTAQYNEFNKYTVYTLNNQMYQRVDKNTIRVNLPYDSVVTCNYLMFKNTNYSDKWFYAFLQNARYVNESVTEITYIIDVIQSWFLDCTLRDSYIIREHSLKDTPGSNIVAEDIDLGPYVSEPYKRTNDMLNMSVCVWCADTEPFVAESVGYVETFDNWYMSGAMTGMEIAVWQIGPAIYMDHTDGETPRAISSLEMKARIEDCGVTIRNVLAQNYADSVANIVMMPSVFLRKNPAPGGFDVILSDLDWRVKLGDYEPQNKKLMTYPYNLLYVNTDTGENGVYRWEWFDPTMADEEHYDGKIHFGISGTMSPNPEISCIPRYYNHQKFNVDEQILLNGFPQVASVIDTFKSWVVQNGLSQFIKTTASIGGIVGGAVTGNPTAVIAGVGGLTKSISDVATMSLRPDTVKGTQGNSINNAMRAKDFYFTRKHITEDYAKLIDDYFQKYGYKSGELKVPNISSRPHYNYTRTDGCNIIGNNAPSNVVKEIASIFDKGITFWKYMSEVGKYKNEDGTYINNRPTTS